MQAPRKQIKRRYKDEWSYTTTVQGVEAQGQYNTNTDIITGMNTSPSFIDN